MNGRIDDAKELIVVALAAAIALPVPALADNANVNIYGLANLSFDMTNNGNNGTQGASTNKVQATPRASDSRGRKTWATV